MLFGADWAYGELSAFVRQQVACVHAFEMGLIGVPDLKYHVARAMVAYRPALLGERKLQMHERALAQGQDDPLKPDYSRFLPKKRRRVLSNIVPLEHGHLTNLRVYDLNIMDKAALKLQNRYRGLQSRGEAEFAAKKQAFEKAREIALREARTNIEAEFGKKEAEGGVPKMKWDAKVRMKQAKLRGAGQNLDRKAVVNLMMEESMDAAEAEVKARFLEIAYDRGFEIPPDPERDAPPPIPTGEEAITVQMKALSDRMGAFIKDPRKAMKVQGVKKEDDYKIETPRGEAEERALALAAAAKLEAAETPPLTALRQAAMMVGMFPPELYNTGETPVELDLRDVYATPDPPLEKLMRRLRALDPAMTKLKTEELLLELPSKRLVLRYLDAFRGGEIEDWGPLEADLKEHFRFQRHAKEIGIFLRHIAESDLEAGVMAAEARLMSDAREPLLRGLVEKRAEGGLEEARRATEKRARSKQMQGLTLVEQVAMQMERETTEIGRRVDIAKELQTTIDKNRDKLVKIERTLVELRRRQTNTRRYSDRLQGKALSFKVMADVRADWMPRYAAALAAKDDDDGQRARKNAEIAAVCNEFIDAATHCATTIVDEFFKPESAKTIKPAGKSNADGRAKEDGRARGGTIFKYEACNIRFKVWLDDHGIFNGSDECAAKAAGHDVRASLEYAKCHVSGLTVPLEATVDYNGFRVLCVARLPLVITVFNESGDVRKSAEEFVHGTRNRGETVVNMNRSLDAKLSEAAQRLNLARHGVKGEKDLNSKYLFSSVDLRGFRGADVPGASTKTGGTFYLLNFWRGFPPEDPDETPHLAQTPRGSSIFWRMLRPELVRRAPTPLSPDANCLIASESPDCVEHTDAARAATKQLIEEVIPRLAEELAARPLRGDASRGFGIDLRADLHRNGINLRHLGLLRYKFWRTLSAPVDLMFNERHVKTHGDLRLEIQRGDRVRIEGTEYRVSIDSNQEWTAEIMPLDRKVTALSKNHCKIASGAVARDETCAQLRLLLLAEMAARAFKNVLRQYLRSAAFHTSAVVRRLQTYLVVQFFNIVTGAHARAEEFWREQLYHAIVLRYGPDAVSVVERQNVQLTLEPAIVYVLQRLQSMLGVRIQPATVAHFLDGPIGE